MIKDASQHIPEERIANRAGVASFFQISPMTVDDWLRRGCPYMQRGGRGIAWQFDLLAVAQWRYRGQQDRKDAGKQASPENLAPRERYVWYQGSILREKYRLQIGELVEAAKYEEDLAKIIKIVIAGIEPLEDRLERDSNLPPDALKVVGKTIRALRNSLHMELKQFAEDLETRQKAEVAAKQTELESPELSAELQIDSNIA